MKRQVQLPSASSSHVREARRTLIKKFLASAPNQCENCSAPKRILRKEGLGKLFLRPLTQKGKSQLSQTGRAMTAASEEQRRKAVGPSVESKEDDLDASDAAMRDDEGSDSEDSVGAEVGMDEAVLGSSGASKSDQYLTPVETRAQLQQL